MELRNEDITVDLDNYSENMDLGDLFEKDAPVEIEVGSGKGTFLLNQARLHGDINYLGIEWANKYYKLSVDRMRRWGMRNVRVLRTDARDFIGRYVPDESVQAFHIYFPDPWPKARHNKRRFFQRENILQVHRILKAGGQLRTATDHAEYYEAMREVMFGDGVVTPLFEEIEFHALDAANEGEWVGSNFERKYIEEGRTINTLAFAKKG